MHIHTQKRKQKQNEKQYYNTEVACKGDICTMAETAFIKVNSLPIKNTHKSAKAIESGNVFSLLLPKYTPLLLNIIKHKSIINCVVTPILVFLCFFNVFYVFTVFFFFK